MYFTDQFNEVINFNSKVYGSSLLTTGLGKADKRVK